MLSGVTKHGKLVHTYYVKINKNDILDKQFFLNNDNKIKYLVLHKKANVLALIRALY